MIGLLLPALLLVGPRAATALDPAAVDALASIGDGERVRYLDFRDALTTARLAKSWPWLCAPC